MAGGREGYQHSKVCFELSEGKKACFWIMQVPSSLKIVTKFILVHNIWATNFSCSNVPK